MAVPSRSEVLDWSPSERASVARLLDEVADRPEMTGRLRRQRRLIIAVTGFGALLLVPWIVFLSFELSDRAAGGAWRVAWVGFDLALVAAFATTAWLVWQRRQLAITGLFICSTLLVVDAWFDVCLSWGTSEQVGALLTAAFGEIPLAVVMAATALTIMRRTMRMVLVLRGLPPRSARLRTQRFVMAPVSRPAP